MAAYDDRFLISEGQSWSLWADNIGFRSPNSDQDDEESKTNTDKASMQLSREEMALYGCCPRWEEFYLVVCDFCGKAIKPQALQQHIDLRHKVNSEVIKSEDDCDSRSSTKSNRIKNYKIYPDELGRESSTSPLEFSSNENEFNMDESLNYKSLLEEGCSSFDQNSNSLLGNQVRKLSQGCDILSMTENINSTLPLLKMKGKSFEDSFIGGNELPSHSLPHLPPMITPEPQHIIPPRSPHSGPPPSLGPPVSLSGGSIGIGPPTPGQGPPTPHLDPPTPGMAPLTPIMGPPTPGLGPPTPGAGPPTPGMPPTTPSAGPPTPGLGPLTPGLGTPNSSMGPPTPGMSPVMGLGSQLSSQGSMNVCSMTPTYNSQSVPQNIGINPYATSIVSPLTPNTIQQSPNLEHTVPSLSSNVGGIIQNPQLSPHMSHLRNQNIRVNSPSSDLGLSLSANETVDSVHINCLQESPSNQITQTNVLRNNTILTGSTSVEEANEVNRISAMLMKEAEALSYRERKSHEPLSSNFHSLVDTRNVIEAQGIATGRVVQDQLSNQMPVLEPLESSLQHSNAAQVSGNNVNVSQSQGSVPIPMSSMSMATLKQIQDDLLATVSESDLNAVLNATPDTSVLPDNSHCLSGDASMQQYSNRNGLLNKLVSNSNVINNQGAVQYGGNDLSSVDIFSKNLVAAGNSDKLIHSTSFSSNLRSSRENTVNINQNLSQLSFSNAQISHGSDISQSGNSITKLGQKGPASSSLESQLGLVSLLQQPIQGGQSLNLQSSSLPPSSSQGITVVIGGNQSNSSNVTVSRSSLNNSMIGNANFNAVNSNLGIRRKTSDYNEKQMQNLVSVAISPDSVDNEQCTYSNQQINVTQSKKVQSTAIQSKSHMQTQFQSNRSQFSTDVTSQSQQTSYLSDHVFTQPSVHTTTQLQLSQAQQSHQNVTPNSVPPPTFSPKKSTKKKKPGERKLLPLKDREYDPEVHCGVLIADTGKPCARSLTCKTHSLSLRRAVLGRSKKFDELLHEHKAAKEALVRASKTPDMLQSSFIQTTPPRSSGNSLSDPSMSSSLLARTLSGGIPPEVLRVHSTPSPNMNSQHHQSLEQSSPHLQATPPSPAYPWPSSGLHQRVVVPLSHNDNFYVRQPPKPLAVCGYNSRKFGGCVTTDHKLDVLRSALAYALKKPKNQTQAAEVEHLGSGFSSNVDRVNNVKPMLARKLQTTSPYVNGPKEGVGVAVSIGYNGQIQFSGNSGVPLGNAATVASLKRQSLPEVVSQTSVPVVNARTKTKKVKSNETQNSINYLSNVVQVDASGNKNHFPVVAVSLQNGFTNPQTITLGNVPIANVRNSANQPIRLHTPLTVRDTQTGEVRTQTSAETANIVLGSGIPSGSFVIADTLKPLKNDPSAQTTLRLDGSKLIPSKIPLATGSGSGTGINLVGAPTALVAATTTVTTPTGPQQGQVYFTAVSGSNNTQLLQQLLNCKIGKGAGVKFLSPTPSAPMAANNRQTFVLQQEKEPS